MRRCPSCGEENGDRARFCLACGAQLVVVGAPREERRVVSVLFVDLVGFTSRSERLDPEDVRAMLSRYYDRARAEIERFGGTVEKFIGDAVMAVFGAPVAHGDDPERAVRAALAVRDAIAEMDFGDPLLELQTRAAVNTGEAVVELKRQPGAGVAMVAGDVVNTASRLQSSAPVDSVVVGEETYASTRTVIAYEPLEALVVKGKADPVPAWVAIRPLVAAGERTFSEVPIVGRGEELATLRGTWDLVSSERRPTLVTMFGPAGIGKSRLAQQLAELSDAYDSDAAEVALGKLRSRAAALEVSEDADELAEHLAILSGLPVEGSVADRETLFFSARLFLEAVARERPTLLVFEDLHFADPSLMDLVEFLASRVQDVPLLLVVTARPELLTARPSWGGGLPASSTLSLGLLSRDDAVELTERLFAQRGLGDLADRAGPLAATSDGNPLFIEELTASIAERSTRDPDRLPSSIRSIVAARLDSLPEPERNAIFDAAVVGKVFWRGVLERLRPDTQDLSSVLGSLERRDLIRREASSRIKGEQQFAFKHGLIREVAYLTLPREDRRRCHRATAEYLEEVTLRAGDADATLAHHWREGGEPEPALRHLLAAAELAGRGWAKARAVALYGQALELVPEDAAELKKEIVRERALAAAASYHEMMDMGGEGGPPGPGGSG